MTLGAIVITAVALVVGLGVLYLSWRFVDNLPTDRPGEPVEEQDRTSESQFTQAPEREQEGDEEPRPSTRSRAAEWMAGAAIAMGLAGIILVLIRELGSR